VLKTVLKKCFNYKFKNIIHVIIAASNSKYSANSKNFFTAYNEIRCLNFSDKAIILMPEYIQVKYDFRRKKYVS